MVPLLKQNRKMAGSVTWLSVINRDDTISRPAPFIFSSADVDTFQYPLPLWFGRKNNSFFRFIPTITNNNINSQYDKIWDRIWTTI